MEREHNERKEIGKLYFYFERSIPELPIFIEAINNFIKKSHGAFYVQLVPDFYISLQINHTKIYDMHIFAKFVNCVFSDQIISNDTGMNIVYEAAKCNAPVELSCERREAYNIPIGHPDPYGNQSFCVTIMEPQKSDDISNFMQNLQALLK